LCIRTPAGTVLHTGDFKFDRAPSDGELTDETRLAQIGEQGVDLLLSDSTNVDELGEAGSEGDVREHLLDVVRSSERRVFVALFASNVQRLLSLGEIARETGRRLCALGTSLVRHIEIARDLGLLPWPRDFVLSPEAIRTYPPGELLVLTSGTQAEPGSALWRLARREHKFADVQAGDRVVFSSRIIPGRERQVVTMVCDLLRLGARVEWGRRSGAHTSGHACRDEQTRMIELLSPRAFVPVHGTLHHLLQHGALARELGVPRVEVVENGQTLVLVEGLLGRGERVCAGEVCVGYGGEVLASDELQCRRELARGGHLTIAVACDSRARLLARPVVRASGVPLLDPAAQAALELENLIEKEWSSVRRRSAEALEALVGRLARRFLEARHLAPVITVAITGLDEPPPKGR
jgi:ribonuclease J